LTDEPRIRQAIFGVSGIAIFSKLLGFLREMVIAERFGTSHQYDILLIAIAAPIFLNLVVSNATNFLAVPFLSQKMSERGTKGKWRSFWEVGNSFLIIAILIVAGIIVAAPLLVKMVGPELTGAELTDAIFYCRAIAILVLLTFLESYFRSALNVKKEFVYPAAGTIILNIIAIAAIYLFSGQMSVMAIILGLIVGTFCQMLFQFARLAGFGVLKDFHFGIWGKETKGLFAVGGMIIVVELLSRTYFMIDRYFAGGLQVGVVSALNYGSLLVMLPVSVAGMAVAAVTFPHLSDRANGASVDSFAALLYSTLRLSLIIGLSCGIFYLAFARELTAAVFFRGAFDLNSLEMTSNILFYLGPHLVCLFLYTVLLQSCYAAGKQKLVVIIAIIALFLKFFLTGLLKNLINYQGIALATSLVEMAVVIMMIYILKREGRIKYLGRLATLAAQVAIASIPMMAIGYFYKYLPDFSSGMSLLLKFRVIPAGILSGLSFLLFAYWLGIREIKDPVSKFILKRK
jgi:putative peptidoglycan lipid II flippase